MSLKTRVLNAACKSGKVTINGVELPGAVICSAGQAQSQGLAILCGAEAFYIAVPIDTLSKLIELVAQVTQTVSTGVLPSNGGGNITSGTFAADLMLLKTQLDQLKEQMQ